MLCLPYQFLLWLDVIQVFHKRGAGMMMVTQASQKKIEKLLERLSRKYVILLVTVQLK